MKLDRFDVRILETLRVEGRITVASLAKRVGLSSSPTWQRMRRLEEAGLIRGYHADIDINRLAKSVTVVAMVSLSGHRAQDFRRFDQAVEKIPEIVECVAVGGEVDYVLRFVTPAIEEYQAIIDRLLRDDLGITRYWTYVVTKPVKQSVGAALDVMLHKSSGEKAD